MQLKARRHAKWFLTAAAAVMLTACSSWWVASVLDAPHLDLVAVLIIAGAGAAAIGWSGLRR